MRKLVLVGVCLLLFMGVTAVAQDEPVTMDLDTALSYYQNDSFMIEYSDAGKTQLLEMINAFRTALGLSEDLDETSEDKVGALEIDMSLKDVVNRLSQAYYTLANVFVDPSENKDIYIMGKNWGFKSLRMNPEFDDLRGGRFDESVARETDAAALYWTNSNWLRVAQKDPMGAVFGGIPKKTQMISERLLEIAPNYLSGGAYRSYGAYYSGLPALFGRDLGKALCYLCPVVDEPGYCAECEIAEHVPGTDAYFENRSFFVEFYLMPKKQWEDAARILQSILDDPIGDQYPFMNAYSQENARELLAEVQEHL